MSIKRKEDLDLIDRIRNDDEKAFNALFTKYYKFLCFTANTVFNDPHKAKDTVQEVFLGIWKRRKTIKISQSVNAYLSRAVKNKTIDYIRSQRLDFNAQPTETEAQNNAPLEFKELQEVIDTTVRNLPERCRIIFLMSRFDYLSHKEIAKKLDISEKTIENQITTALKRIKVAIRQYKKEY